jgi:hypothetical protein
MIASFPRPTTRQLRNMWKGRALTEETSSGTADRSRPDLQAWPGGLHLLKENSEMLLKFRRIAVLLNLRTQQWD